MFFFVLFLGFLDKNNDLLYRSGKEVILILIYYASNYWSWKNTWKHLVHWCCKFTSDMFDSPWKVMRQSKNAIIKLCFPSTESDSKKRPETVRSVSAGRWNHAFIYKLTLLFVSPLRWWLSSRTVWRAWRRSFCLKNPGMSAALNPMKPSSQVSPCAPKKIRFYPMTF